ncbi:MAG: hypothetical protein K0U84_03365 [Actinomycetia bacterium]|nr:hypothetical protein [Actinomycetes bacterium]
MSWLLVGLIPGMLMLAAIALDRVESGISREAALTAGKLADLVPASDLATDQSLHHHSNPEFQPTPHANPV